MSFPVLFQRLHSEAHPIAPLSTRGGACQHRGSGSEKPRWRSAQLLWLRLGGRRLLCILLNRLDSRQRPRAGPRQARGVFSSNRTKTAAMKLCDDRATAHPPAEFGHLSRFGAWLSSHRAAIDDLPSASTLAERMDDPLRCNSLSCRKELAQSAVVTTWCGFPSSSNSWHVASP